jgi:hypothetical protein
MLVKYENKVTKREEKEEGKKEQEEVENTHFPLRFLLDSYQ